MLFLDLWGRLMAAGRSEPKFFRTSAAFGKWLASNHATKTELWIGFYKKAAEVKEMSYAEAVEEALCWGWIDGLVRSLDERRFQQRFTPRRSKSTWSLVNVARVGRLVTAGRMRPPGIAAFKARGSGRMGIYSFEQTHIVLTPVHRVRFSAASLAWKWFSAQSDSYRAAAIHWVNSAKRAETRDRRLATLTGDSAKKTKLPWHTPRVDRIK